MRNTMDARVDPRRVPFRTLLLLFLSFGFSVAAPSSRLTARETPSANQEIPLPGVGSLCDLLENVGEGEELQGIVSGIYLVTAEVAYLFDPDSPYCELDVQPTTDIAFESRYLGKDLLDRAIGASHRAYVTLRGKLRGPTIVGDDLTISAESSAFNRLNHRHRYGHLNLWRTQFLVSEVLAARPVPDSVPEIGDLTQERPASRIPRVVSAAIPTYPRVANQINLGGEVIVTVTVSSGKLAKAEIRSGDRILAAAALENIQSWKFEADAGATFDAAFRFVLERRKSGADPNPRIEMHLPLSVQIVAPLNGW